jgi:hypothetical protein
VSAVSKKSRRANLKPPGKCIFCGQGNLTKEHFWPEWASSLLPQFPVKEHEEHLHTYIMKTVLVKLPEVTSRQGAVSTKKIRVVCKSCNSGWMSGLETAVRPILTPLILAQPGPMSSDAAATLAQWIAMKVMVSEHNQRDQWVTPQAERAAFMTTRDIPLGFRIWIGQCGLETWGSAFLRHSGMVMWPNLSPPARKNVQSVTFGIGDLLVHAFHTTLSGLTLYSFDKEPRAMVPLHPISPPIVWPPLRHLSVAEANGISRAFSYATRGSNVLWKSLPG